MKTIRITDDCLIEGRHTPAGTVLENLPNELADQLLSSGRAAIIPNAPEVIHTSDPAVEHRDPEPEPAEKKGGKGKGDKAPPVDPPVEA